jgi:ADP-heptose:LPS heptosyltransferase
MCRLAGLTGEISLRPYLTLTDAERAAAPRMDRQIAIQSTGLNAAIPYSTKEWGSQRFAEVARLLSTDFPLVQLGAARDPLLPGVALDLRGKTTLREAAAIQAASLCFVGLEGFLAHLARAVDVPSVIVHGGRAPAGIFDYPANINFYARPDCSPCGLQDGCPYGLKCMTAITPEQVAAAVRKLAASPRAALPVETTML